MDDFGGDAANPRASQPTVEQLLRWTDGQECPIEIKGSQWTVDGHLGARHHHVEQAIHRVVQARAVHAVAGAQGQAAAD